MKLSAFEFGVYRESIVLLMHSEEYLCHDEFHALMGYVDEELESVLDWPYQEEHEEYVDLPSELVGHFICLLNQLGGYPFAKAELSKLEGILKLDRASLEAMSDSLKARLESPGETDGPQG